MSMAKVKNIFLNVTGKLKEQNRIAKIICFFVGFFFNIVGIVCVLIWKYVFCSNNEKTKYCTRVSILGMIANLIICGKFFSFLFFNNFNKEVKNFNKHYPAVVNSNFFGIDDFFEREMIKMNNAFEENQRMMDKMFSESEKNINDKNKIKKEVKNLGNGYQETIIETSTPNSYKKVVKTEYVGKNEQNNIKQINNDEKIANPEQVEDDDRKVEEVEQAKVKNIDKKKIQKKDNSNFTKSKKKKSCNKKKCNVN